MKRSTLSFISQIPQIQGTDISPFPAKTKVPPQTGMTPVLKSLYVSLDAAKSEEKKARMELDQVKAELEDATEEENQRGDSISPILQQLEELKAIKDKINEETTQLQNNLKENTKKLAEIDKRSVEYKKRAEEEKIQLNELIEKSKSAEEKKADLCEKIAKIEAKRDVMRERISSLQKGKDQLAQQNSDLEKSLAAINEEVEIKRKDLASHKKVIAEHELKLKSMREINETLQRDIIAKKEDLKTKRDEEDKLHEVINGLKEDLKEVDAAITKTLNDQEVARQAQAKDNQQLTEIKKQLEILRAKADEEAANEQKLKDEVSAAQTSLQAEKQKEEELQTRLQSIIKQNNELESKNRELEQLISMKEASVRDAEAQLQITKQKIEDEKQSYNISKAQIDTETARSMELIQAKKAAVKMLKERRDQLKRELEEEVAVLNAQQDQTAKLQMELAAAQVSIPMQTMAQPTAQPMRAQNIRKDRCLELFEENAF